MHEDSYLFSFCTYSDSSCIIWDNYWGTISALLIDAAIYDYNEDPNLPPIIYQPILTTPPETAYPFVADVILSTQIATNTKIVGAETVTFTVSFNRDMDLTVQPSVSFGPDVPYTDYTAHTISGGWQNARTWKGNFNVTPITGDGYQLMRIAGPARAASDPWLVIGDDAARFRFEIITSGTEAMALQATGKGGRVELSWMQNDFDMLAGYNLYRSTTQGGNYARLNPNIIPPFQKTYIDSNVQPGQPYYYKFSVVKTDMTESAFSNISSGTPLDTIPPVITHTPVTGAPLGLPIQIYADVTDNVGVTAVTLYYRPIGTGPYTSASMVNTSGNRWSVNIPGSSVNATGLHYYLTAEDGVNITYHGNAGNPHQITVVDQPQVTNISPNRGPAAGGTAVAIAGTKFKAGASLKFGDTLATNPIVVSSTNITATTPAHYPAVVDIIVTNPDGKHGSLLQAFTYEGSGTVVSLPNASGDINGIVEIPLSISNVEGLLGAYTVITFNSSVITAQSARNGNMASGWSLAANTGTPGRVNLSLAGATASCGSGNLAHITFRVVGNSLATTALTLDTVRLNDGAITATSSHGYFTVNDLFDVSGRVTYYQGGAGVASVAMNMIGSQPYATVANSLGYFNIMGMASSPYTLTPAKSDQANGITSYDASLALQAEVGLISLSSNQQKAADVNKNGIVSAMDASYILQKSAGLIDVPFPGAGKVWDFVPPERTYQPLNSDRSSQDFAAILIGDISGNWSGAGGQGMVRLWAEATGSATLTLAQAKALPQGQVTVPLNLSLTQGSLYGADIVIGYDASVATAPIVNKGSLAGGFSMAANLNQPGQIRVAMAGATPVTGSGELLNMAFKVLGPSGTISPLQIMSADLNEGAISTQLQNGSIVINLLASVNMPPGWNMFSYPFLSDPSTHIGQLADDITAGLYVFHYNPEGGSYITTNEASAGWGYWVRVSANTPVDGTGFPAGKTADFELPLGMGWNQIGNPFNANVSWGNVKVKYSGQTKTLSEANSAGWIRQWLFSYDNAQGGYDVWDAGNGILRPFTGYWVKANVSGAALLIPAPP